MGDKNNSNPFVVSPRFSCLKEHNATYQDNSGGKSGNWQFSYYKTLDFRLIINSVVFKIAQRKFIFHLLRTEKFKIVNVVLLNYFRSHQFWKLHFVVLCINCATKHEKISMWIGKCELAVDLWCLTLLFVRWIRMYEHKINDA